jgi:hypothetical protein
MEDSTNPYKVLVRKSEGKTSLRKSRCKSEDNIKTYIREVGYEGVGGGLDSPGSR